MSSYELAQLNIGIIRGPTAEGNATAIRPFENENLLVNMSVRQDADSLRAAR